jgi:hypothetical protein
MPTFKRDPRQYRVDPYGRYEEVIDGGAKYERVVKTEPAERPTPPRVPRVPWEFRRTHLVTSGMPDVATAPADTLNRFGIGELMDIPPEEIYVPPAKHHPDDYTEAARSIRAKYNMALGLPVPSTRRFIEASFYAEEARAAERRIRVRTARMMMTLEYWERISR